MSTGKIKVGSVSLPIYKVAQGWRVSYYDAGGKRQHITSKDKAKVVEKARKIAREIHNQASNFADISPDDVSLLKRVLSLGITHADLDDWQRSRSITTVSLRAAVLEFLDEKDLQSDGSAKNFLTLKSITMDLERYFGETNLGAITLPELKAWLKSHKDVSKRRLTNLRAGAVTFFRWCANQHYLPEGKTNAERLVRVSVKRGVPTTYTPTEMRLMLQRCQEIYPSMIPWLVLVAFAGIRHEELTPDPRSTKPPLDWSDFKWDRRLLIVRPETAKTGHRRVITLSDNVIQWLAPHKQPSGAVSLKSPNSTRLKKTFLTKILGEPIGGWKINALRHSFISYRAALVGLAQTAMEAGNSESEAKRSYNDAKGRDEANAWFGIVPDNF